MITRKDFEKHASAKNYSLLPNVDYIGGDEKYPIKCHCGHVWYIRYSNLKAGYGCPECKRRKHINHLNVGMHDKENKIDNTEYLKRLSNIRDDLEIVDGEIYKNASTKIKMRCKVCGHEWGLRPHHAMSGSRCPECNRKEYNDRLIDSKLVGDFENIERLSKLGDLPDKLVEFYCKDCGETFQKTPSLLFNNGARIKCPKCAEKHHTFGFSLKSKGSLYLATVVVNDTILYKVGITNRKSKVRLKESFKRFYVYKEFHGDGESIARLEKTVKRLMKPYEAFERGQEVDCSSGYTEIYTENPLLIISKQEIQEAFKHTK